jgi:hypothetical protein
MTDATYAANEYVTLHTDKGLSGDALALALRKDAANAREWGQDELADAIDAIAGGDKISRTFSVKGQTFTSDLTDAEAIEVLRSSKSNFARSLVQQYDSPRTKSQRARVAANGESTALSPAQWPWVHKLAMDARVAKPVPAPVANMNVSAIVAIMQNAAKKLKYPKISLDLPQGRIRIQIAGAQSRYAGQLMITDGAPFGSNVWYGRVMQDGSFVPSNKNESWVTDALLAMNNDPATYASVYGRKTGNCCFCHRELSTKESLHVGYGPVCADHYGLPWGHVA